MSKMDNNRAMREARYEAAQKAAKAKAGGTPAKAKPAAPVAPTAESVPVTAAPTETPSSDEALCGHRSMNGRTCTREQGHSAKSHRYS